MELEGLRGLAAIAVVFHHYIFAFYPALNTGRFNVAHTRFDEYIYGTPLAVLYAGTFAVALFFVLSGFVLSIGFFQTKDENIVRKLATSRYLRLMLPALGSVIIAYILIKVGVSNVMNLTASASGSNWLMNEWGFNPGFFDAIFTATFHIFTSQGTAFNNVLWTMHTEFFGSFMVFAVLLLFAKSRYRWITYVILTIATFNTWFLPFIIGMIIADMHALGWIEALRQRLIVFAMLTLGILLGSYPHSRVKGTFYEHLSLGVNISYEKLYLTIGATLLILAILSSKKLTSLLAKPGVSVLGKYTFSLYLVHLLVLYSVTCAIFLLYQESLGYNKAVFIACALSVPALILATIAFEKYIDAPSIRFAKWISAIYRGDVAFKIKKPKFSRQYSIRRTDKKAETSLRLSDDAL